ncbi:plasmid mobilization protein [Bradyrhizobium sp. USDA 3315]
MSPSDGRQRRFRVTIRVSLSERQAVDAAASRSGITLSAYAQHALVNAKPLRAARRPSVDMSLLVSVLDRLGGIASTMRAISRLLSARAELALPSSMERDLARSLSDLRALRPQLIRALRKRPEAP